MINPKKNAYLLFSLLFSYFISLHFHSCKYIDNKNEKSIYCFQLDTMEDDFHIKKHNPCCEKYIPEIERVSQIRSKQIKDARGDYYYNYDSSFRSDLKLWRDYFNCP